MSLLCQKIYPDSKIPVRQNVGDGGFDVFAYLRSTNNPTFIKNLAKMGCWLENESKTPTLFIPPGCRACIPIGVAVQCPSDTVFQVWPRSGLALKKGVDVLAGLVDSGYRKEVGVVLINHSAHNVEIKHEDRIAQLVPVRLNHGSQLMFQDVDSLDESQRGTNGFGSSGN